MRFRHLLLLSALAAGLRPGPALADMNPKEAPRAVPYGADPMQAGDLYLPDGEITASTPKLLLLHGGGWRSEKYLRGTLSDEAALFRDAGYAVFNVDYRLAPAAAWPAIGDDCLAAARKLVSCDGIPLRSEIAQRAMRELCDIYSAGESTKSWVKPPLGI